MPALAPRQQKITLAEMRASGVRGLLIYLLQNQFERFDKERFVTWSGTKS
jgi:hypothetical protein